MWLTDYLHTELRLELSADKTLVTNAKDRVRFLGYEIERWAQTRILRARNAKYGVVTKRTTNYHLKLLIPRDKCKISHGRMEWRRNGTQKHVRTYCAIVNWKSS